MSNYRRISQDEFWTMTETPGKGIDGMTIKDENVTYHFTLLKYPEDVCNDIMEQAKEYVMVEDICTEKDGNREERHYRSEIMPKSFIVKDNKFVGIFTLGRYLYEVHMHIVDSAAHMGILFADGTIVGENYDEYECQPGAFKSRTDYSLEKR